MKQEYIEKSESLITLKVMNFVAWRPTLILICPRSTQSRIKSPLFTPEGHSTETWFIIADATTLKPLGPMPYQVWQTTGADALSGLTGPSHWGRCLIRVDRAFSLGPMPYQVWQGLLTGADALSGLAGPSHWGRCLTRFGRAFSADAPSLRNALRASSPRRAATSVLAGPQKAAPRHRLHQFTSFPSLLSLHSVTPLVPNYLFNLYMHYHVNPLLFWSGWYRNVLLL